jgi:hypothetical protein
MSTDVFIKMTERFIRPVEGITSLLQKLLYKGLNLAICSNHNAFWIKRPFEKHGLCHFSEPSNLISSSRFGFSKIRPNFEMSKAIMDVTNDSSFSYILTPVLRIYNGPLNSVRQLSSFLKSRLRELCTCKLPSRQWDTG